MNAEPKTTTTTESEPTAALTTVPMWLMGLLFLLLFLGGWYFDVQRRLVQRAGLWAVRFQAADLERFQPPAADEHPLCSRGVATVYRHDVRAVSSGDGSWFGGSGCAAACRFGMGFGRGAASHHSYRAEWIGRADHRLWPAIRYGRDDTVAGCFIRRGHRGGAWFISARTRNGSTTPRR